MVRRGFCANMQGVLITAACVCSCATLGCKGKLDRRLFFVFRVSTGATEDATGLERTDPKGATEIKDGDSRGGQMGCPS